MRQLLTIFLYLTIAQILIGQTTKLDSENSKSYFYNLKIQYQDFSSSMGCFYLIKNTEIVNDWVISLDSSSLKSKKLYLIKFDYYYPTMHMTMKDTVSISLSSCQMDTIFTLTKAIFEISNKVNHLDVIRDESKYFTPLSNYDGVSASIDFDLSLLGEKYYVYISRADPIASNNFEYKRLINYLMNIVEPFENHK